MATSRQLSRADYADHLRAMWLGQAIANWTGLTTEGDKQSPPFYTDDDWGRDPGQGSAIDFVFQDPWLADDDTDIEYLYMHLIQKHNTPLLSPEQIAAGWVQHVNDAIWGGTPERQWMQWGALPPVTGMGPVNDTYLMNTAQLITEAFGALAPGMPDQALRLADLPIRTIAGGYSAHAAQFHIVLYSLAAQVDPQQSRREQILWLVEQARQYLPDISKAADVVDVVLADYLANPNVDDWERTRDLIYERYHDRARDNGFVYRGWLESSVNFATGLMALLYGEGDYTRTVQIGTLSGWDSDNGTATMGGLLGLLLGYDALAAEFPDVTLSDRYSIHRTRPTLPDYLPDDPAAEDTFSMMAGRMLPYVERTIVEAGGSADGDRWTLPPLPEADPLSLNPLVQLYRRSANNQVRLAGGNVETSATGERSAALTRAFADGVEHDFSGREVMRPSRIYSASPENGVVTFTVTYDRPVEVGTIRFIEGGDSGFTTIAAEIQLDGVWQPIPEGTFQLATPNPDIPLQMIDFVLPEPVQATGIRVTGNAGGVFAKVTIMELDALAEAP
ncbi:MAG: ADP-ribosylglycohydrolase family protein [Anaerolineae bacterium]|nr:ADP-ribosylglycohydrolase family protein [Anaerolineae bacterium]